MRIKTKKKHSVSLTLNTIAISILFLIVLITLIFIFVNQFYKKYENLQYEEKKYNIANIEEKWSEEEIKIEFIRGFNNFITQNFGYNFNMNIENVEESSLYNYLKEELKNYKSEEEIKEDLIFILEFSKRLKIPIEVSTYIYLAEKTPRHLVSKTCRYGAYQISEAAVIDAKGFLKKKFPSIFNELKNIEERYKEKCKYNDYSCVGGCKCKKPEPQPWMIVTCKDLSKNEELEVVKLNIAYGIAYIGWIYEKINKKFPNIEENLKWLLTIISYHLGIGFTNMIEQKIKNNEISLNDLRNPEILMNLMIEFSKKMNYGSAASKTYAIYFFEHIEKMSYLS